MVTDVVMSNDGYTVVTGNKRKSDSMPSSSGKKTMPSYNVQIGERFESLNEVTEDMVTVEGSCKKPPPIIIDCKMEEIETLLAQCATIIGTANFTVKILNKSGRVRINPKNKEMHKQLSEGLAKKNKQFHSFTEESERDYTVVILGLYEIDPETVKSAIANAGIKDIKTVASRKNKANIPLFVARFNRGSTNLKELNQKCSLLCNCVVTWQPFSPAIKEYTQCYNCQQYGHAAANCNRMPRCIKCLEMHDKGKCARTSREGTAKCVNCKGDHAANYKGCSAYQIYKNARISQQIVNVRPREKFVLAPPPKINFWEQRVAAAATSKPSVPEKKINIPEQPPVQPQFPPANIFAGIKSLTQELQQIPNITEIFNELQQLINIIKSAKSAKEAAVEIAMYYMSAK